MIPKAVAAIIKLIGFLISFNNSLLRHKTSEPIEHITIFKIKSN